MMKRWQSDDETKRNKRLTKTRKQSVYSFDVFFFLFFSETNDRPSRTKTRMERRRRWRWRTVDRRFSNTTQPITPTAFIPIRFRANCRRHLVIIRYSSRRTSNADPWPRLESLGTDDLGKTTNNHMVFSFLRFIFYFLSESTSSSLYFFFLQFFYDI